MAIIDGIVLALALLGGGAIGVLLTAAHYERIAARHRAWEREAAERQDLPSRQAR
jgi:hypothetical protein